MGHPFSTPGTGHNTWVGAFAVIEVNTESDDSGDTPFATELKLEGFIAPPEL